MAYSLPKGNIHREKGSEYFPKENISGVIPLSIKVVGVDVVIIIKRYIIAEKQILYTWNERFINCPLITVNDFAIEWNQTLSKCIKNAIFN